MSTYRLGLYFRDRASKDGLPGQPVSHVYVKHPLGYEYPDAKEAVFLTNQEFGPEVIENQIDALIEELQAIKRQVRAKYLAYDRKLSKDSN